MILNNLTEGFNPQQGILSGFSKPQQQVVVSFFIILKNDIEKKNLYMTIDYYINLWLGKIFTWEAIRYAKKGGSSIRTIAVTIISSIIINFLMTSSFRLRLLNKPTKFCRDIRLSIIEYPGYDSELYLIVKLEFWGMEVFLHCYYSKIHSNMDWLYLLMSNLWVK